LRHGSSQLGLHAGERAVELLRGGGGSFDLSQRFMEDFGDVQETDNIAFFVANRLCEIEIPSAPDGYVVMVK
jgi:hypothetical protein